MSLGTVILLALAILAGIRWERHHHREPATQAPATRDRYFGNVLVSDDPACGQWVVRCCCGCGEAGTISYAFASHISALYGEAYRGARVPLQGHGDGLLIHGGYAFLAPGPPVVLYEPEPLRQYPPAPEGPRARA